MKKILVIEPDLFLSGLICEFIEIGGFEAEDVDYFDDGWELALSGDHDLILLDLKWAILNGFSLDRLLGALWKTRVIFLAGLEEIDGLFSGGRAATADLLLKPFTFMELILKVKEALAAGEHQIFSPPSAWPLSQAGYSPQVPGEKS